MSRHHYKKPEIERFGSFRELTHMGFPFGSFGSNDMPGFSSHGGGGESSAETGDPGGRS